MKKLLFSGLIAGGMFFITAGTKGQSFANNGSPVIASPADHNGLLAYQQDHSKIVVLQWTAGDEKNVDRYVIERATDSIHFDPLHEFTPLHEVVSTGSITGDSIYRDMDSYPQTSPTYYRLRTVMNDGSSTVTDPVRIDINTRRTPVIKPTVLHMGGTLRLDNFEIDNYHQQPLTVNFFSENGTLTGSFIVNSTSFEIPTSGWSTGVFYYRISNAHHALIDAGKIMIL